MMREINPDLKKMKKPESWADLPMDILTVIMEKLFLSERLPLCLVCRTWNECCLQIQNVEEEQFLPWVMTYEKYTCKLHDPSAQTSPHIVKEAPPCGLDAWDLEVWASRNGRILFSKIVYDEPISTTYYREYFLYSPFNKEVIKFPKLMRDFRRKATFTERPGSPDCMVIVFSIQSRNLHGNYLHIKTCHPGDKSWKIFKIKSDFGWDFITDVACVGDLVYCVIMDTELEMQKQLVAFNIKQQDWKVFPGFLPSNSAFQPLIVAFNGVLLLHTVKPHKMEFLGFDTWEEKWVVVEDEKMKKQVIFLGCTSFTVPAVGNAEQYAGMVYSFHPFTFSFHFKAFDSVTRLEEHEQDPWQKVDYKWLKGDFGLQKIWIQPPNQRIWR